MLFGQDAFNSSLKSGRPLEQEDINSKSQAQKKISFDPSNSRKL